jgi:hypothetical protein
MLSFFKAETDIFECTGYYHFSWCKSYHFEFLYASYRHWGARIAGPLRVQLLALDGRDAELAGFVK